MYIYSFYLFFNARVSLIITSTLQIDLLQLFFSCLPLSRVLYVVYVSVENYVLCTRLK